MHQVTVSAPKGKGKQVAELAMANGISSPTVQQVHDAGSNEDKDVVRMETATPQANDFVQALLTASFFDPQQYAVSSQNLMAIVSSEPPAQVSKPMGITPVDVLQDLWMQSHITVGFIARAAASALLLAYGMIENDLITMIAAFLFTPFLAQDLAVAYGLLMGDYKLARQGLAALGTSTFITVLAGIFVATILGGPMQFDQFASIQTNLAISFIVAVAASVATADLSGRREFIGMAAAAQFATFPAWFGISMVLGFPDSETTTWRIVTFLANVVTIMVVSAVVYALLQYRREKIERYMEGVEG
ncbi:MAG: DUF389 domain-containing protein [Anaerolineae bacterium]|nr:DUF389 domain-containing protein [Anaerolineae bacterium]